MKLRMLYRCLIAMLLFSAAAVADILPWGTGDTSGTASASASYGDEYDDDDASGDNGYYTTEGGDFSYTYDVMTDIEGYVDASGGWGRSIAIASASAGPLDCYLSCDSGETTQWYWWDPWPCKPQPATGSMHFEAYTGVYASWDCVTVCEIEEGTSTQTFAWAYAYASATMQ